jgi:hypothetical protein
MPIGATLAKNPDGSLADAEARRNHALRLVARAELAHLIIGEAPVSSAPARAHVVHVLDVIAEVEVVRPHASLVVAAVQHPLPVRYRSIRKLPREPVRAPHAPVQHADLGIPVGDLMKRAAVVPTAVARVLGDASPEHRAVLVRAAKGANV